MTMVPVRDRDRSTFSSAPGRPGDGLRAPGSRWSVHEPTPRALPPGSPPGRPRPDPRRRVDRGRVERLRAVRGDGHCGTGFGAVRRPADQARRPQRRRGGDGRRAQPVARPHRRTRRADPRPGPAGDVVDQQGQERVEGQAVRWVRRVGWRLERRQLRRQEPDVVPGPRHQPLGLLLLVLEQRPTPATSSTAGAAPAATTSTCSPTRTPSSSRSTTRTSTAASGRA